MKSIHTKSEVEQTNNFFTRSRKLKYPETDLLTAEADEDLSCAVSLECVNADCAVRVGKKTNAFGV